MVATAVIGCARHRVCSEGELSPDPSSESNTVQRHASATGAIVLAASASRTAAFTPISSATSRGGRAEDR